MTNTSRNAVNYYEILNIQPSATLTEIKRAFRKKIKEIHPDVHSSENYEKELVHLVYQAYEVLSNKVLRNEFDKTLQDIKTHKENGFVYREFLKSNVRENGNLIKLIFYDLLNNLNEEALQYYEKYFESYELFEKEFSDPEDLMDCSFLIAEEYFNKKKYITSLRLLNTILSYEEKYTYFRHFIQEVIDLIKSILMKPKILFHEELIPILRNISLSIFLTAKDRSFIFVKLSEIYILKKQFVLAGNFYEKALLFYKDAGTKKIEKKLTKR